MFSLLFNNRIFLKKMIYSYIFNMFKIQQNQTINVDQGIEDALDHFAIEPKKCLANPVDVPFFLSVRIVDDEVVDADGNVESGGAGANNSIGAANSGMNNKNENQNRKNPVQHIYQYEQDAAKFARDFEENMVRF